MFTLRTLTAVVLALVLTAGADAADKKGRSGKDHGKAKVQLPKQSHTIGSPARANGTGNWGKNAPITKSSAASTANIIGVLVGKKPPKTEARAAEQDDPFFFDAGGFSHKSGSRSIQPIDFNRDGTPKFAPKSGSPADRYSFGASQTGPYVKEPRMRK